MYLHISTSRWSIRSDDYNYFDHVFFTVDTLHTYILFIRCVITLIIEVLERVK